MRPLAVIYCPKCYREHFVMYYDDNGKKINCQCNARFEVVFEYDYNYDTEEDNSYWRAELILDANNA